jgi:phytoene dehydrogenase-like protein
VTLPGFTHDICSAIHPLGLASPFLRTLPLEKKYGLEWVQPEAPFAQALAPGESVVVEQNLDTLSDALGQDAARWKRLFSPFVARWQDLMADYLGPLPLPPRHPLLMTRFGLTSIAPATTLARLRFRSERARAAFGGLAAHSMMPLEWPAVGGFGMMLGVLAHAVGWPMAKGGSQQIARAMTAYLRDLGGEVRTGVKVAALSELPPSNAVLFDTAPKGVLSIAGEDLTPGYARQLKNYRHGAGVCKVDWALSEPIPWLDPDTRRAATVHVGGTLAQMAASERAIWKGRIAEHPYILLVQHSLFDCSRAPDGQHTAWAYLHTPHGSTEDLSAKMESQIERYAPGFRDVIIGRHVQTAAQMEAYNPNYIGGDINGGVQNLRQLYTRPAVRWNPYRIPRRNGSKAPGLDLSSAAASKLYICSSSTPPGGGVHGMCGYYAAESVLKDLGAVGPPSGG